MFLLRVFYIVWIFCFYELIMQLFSCWEKSADCEVKVEVFSKSSDHSDVREKDEYIFYFRECKLSDREICEVIDEEDRDLSEDDSEVETCQESLSL